jgi:hypothetical protein
MLENRFAAGDAPALEAAAHEPALLLNEGLPALPQLLAETFPPGARKPRSDGFTAEAIGIFLHDLAAHGIVEHAARAAGVSAQAAYAFRNRASGRAFARMWDAVLIHRSRARLAAENQQAATLGCVSRRYGPDGDLIGTYHYRDNRLAMAMLSRLDRLAGSEAPNDGHLRALSEDLDAFIACAAEGGDLDAFVEARRPEPEPAGGQGPSACRAEAPEPPRYRVWETDEGDLITNVPPPPNYHGWQEAHPGHEHYARDLTRDEQAIWLARKDDPAFAVEITQPEDMYEGIWLLAQAGFPAEAAQDGGDKRRTDSAR